MSTKLGMLATFAVATSIASANLIVNGDFLSGTFDPTSSAGPGSFACNATGWAGFQNGGGNGPTVLQLVRGFNPTWSNADNSLWVNTPYNATGVIQTFSPQTTPVNVQADVYVINGRAGIGVGRVGTVNVWDTTGTTNQWVHLNVTGTIAQNNGFPYDMIAIYSDSQGAQFFVDNVVVTAVPEPATLAALGLGVLPLLRRRRK